ncbi:MAG: glycoside hydrolase family 3 N-terminal domain-containing protein, partial [bacterium]
MTANAVVATTFLVALIGCAGPSTPASGPSTPDPGGPPPSVDELLSRMTLEEKVGQMTLVERVYLSPESDIRDFALGGVLSGGGSVPDVNEPAAWVDMYNRYQAFAQQTRLRIPLIYGIDAVHGNNNIKGAVIFPHNIA